MGYFWRGGLVLVGIFGRRRCLGLIVFWEVNFTGNVIWQPVTSVDNCSESDIAARLGCKFLWKVVLGLRY